MKTLFGAVFLHITLSYAAAQSDVAAGQLRGRVHDALGAPLSEVRVQVRNPSTDRTAYAVTSVQGEFRVLVLPPGLYEVKVEREAYIPQVKTGVQITVGQIAEVVFELKSGRAETLIVDVTATLPLTEPERTQQATTIDERYLRQLPIDKRDYLTYSLLAPGIVDAEAMADAGDFRPVQTAHSGLSFNGNNGRGNSVRIDGGEMNDNGGGIRPTVSQEAVQEFQINRANYSAEQGNASGGVINIISKSGTNFFHGSAFGFFRDQNLDAADPFARSFIEGLLTRVKPSGKRQQFGATLGGPLAVNRTFFFVAFEGLEKRESNSVSVLTDLSIFDPTPEQSAILAGLPAALATPLRQALTAPASTRALFETNSGIFPFDASDHKLSVRVDHTFSSNDQLLLRYSYANVDERNPNTLALVGLSRGIETSRLDHTLLNRWTHNFNAHTVNQAHLQINYGDLRVSTQEKFGPELNIAGFGFFNRDVTLPSNSIGRRYEFTNDFSLDSGSRRFRLGGQALLRGTHSESQVLFSGRFNFGTLPGSVVNPALAATTITSLQAFSLGLPLLYQQGFGNPTVASTQPFWALYFQSNWNPARDLTFDLGVRYELDVRRKPVPTDVNNIAPRFGFAWNPQRGGTTVRGGLGIFYSPTYYFVDWVASALNDINGRRQIAQVLTTLQTPGLPAAANVFQTLRRQGVITVPRPSRSILPSDLAQFGINVVNEGPLPPLSVLFRTSDDFANSYSEQASLGLERSIGSDFVLSANYLFAGTLKIVRARDGNMLPAPVDPALGLRVWSTPYFKRPELLQENIYESTGRAFYHGVIVELRRRFTRQFGLNVNYTLSKAIDDTVDYTSDFSPNDQLNLRAERALSSFDQRHKLVVYGSMAVPWRITLSPILRASSARPFNLLTGFDLNQDRHSTTDRPAFAGRNTGIGPNFWSLDLRSTRVFRLSENTTLEVMGEAFNVFNRLNFRSVNNTVGNLAGPFDLHGRRDRGPSQPLGFTSAFDARRIQLGARVSF